LSHFERTIIMNENKNKKGTDANRDPITGEPGSHPVGTGVGAVAGGAAGAAAGAATGAALGTAGAGPIGTGIGAVAGALIGGAAGHGTAEGLNPTNSPSEGRYIDYAVMGRDGDKIGTVDSVWLDSDGDPAYLALRTGWLGMGKTHVIPAQRADVSERRREIRLPYTAEQIKSAPDFDASANLQTADEDRIGGYYQQFGFNRDNWLRQRGSTTESTATSANRQGLEAQGETRIKLKEEDLRVGKREVEYGGVRLRKVVRTEVVNQPVELKREEIVVERIPAADRSAATEEFSEDEVYVPLRREEAVVEKQARVREEVRVGKRSETESQTVSDTVRKEDVEIEREESDELSQSRLDKTGERARTGRYEPKERSRS
jgi:uncharacterized protein (TIGR02271 family)